MQPIPLIPLPRHSILLEKLGHVHGALTETLSWLRALHPMPSRSERIRVLQAALDDLQAIILVEERFSELEQSHAE